MNGRVSLGCHVPFEALLVRLVGAEVKVICELPVGCGDALPLGYCMSRHSAACGVLFWCVVHLGALQPVFERCDLVSAIHGNG